MATGGRYERRREGRESLTAPHGCRWLLYFAAMGIGVCAGDRRTGRGGVALLLLGISLAQVMPGDLIWCRADTGHSALELAWAGCCGPTAGAAACTQPAAPAREIPGPTAAGVSGHHCADYWIGAPTAVAPSLPELHTWVLSAAPAPALPVSGPAGPTVLTADADTPISPQARRALAATVLTV